MLHNKILRSGILFFAAIHISIVLNGQTAIQPVAPSVPTSPQAEAFKKYGDFEINYSTGIPDISIPLFEINHRGYKLPIILKYNPQPLRPGYNYDVYGHGWGLSVNSCISRTIEYLPDEWRDFKLETDKLSNSFEVYRRGGGITNIILGMIFLMLFCRTVRLSSLWFAEGQMDWNTLFRIAGRSRSVAVTLLPT